MTRGNAQRTHELFAAVGAAPAGAFSFGGAAPTSVLVHAAALSLLLVGPLWTTPTPPRLERDYVGVLLYDPPPPPPPPERFGSAEVNRRAATADAVPHRPTPSVLTPIEHAAIPEPPATTEPEPAAASAGSPTGSEQGVPEGMEIGQPGGVVGGVPDGVVGGLVGGTGDVPVPVTRVDRIPQLLRRVDPRYPPDAFVKKIQGTVQVEILIDADGRVARTKVTQSVPQLDEAAVAAVRQWVFSPAIKDGRPVATLATAPVTFSLY